MSESLKPETSGESVRKLELKDHNNLQIILMKRSGLTAEEWIKIHSDDFHSLEKDPVKVQLIINYLDKGDESAIHEIERLLNEMAH